MRYGLALGCAVVLGACSPTEMVLALPIPPAGFVLSAGEHTFQELLSHTARFAEKKIKFDAAEVAAAVERKVRTNTPIWVGRLDCMALLTAAGFLLDFAVVDRGNILEVIYLGRGCCSPPIDPSRRPLLLVTRKQASRLKGYDPVLLFAQPKHLSPSEASSEILRRLKASCVAPGRLRAWESGRLLFMEGPAVIVGRASDLLEHIDRPEESRPTKSAKVQKRARR